MNTVEFLAHLRSLDIRLWTEADRLRYSAPKGTLTPALHAELAARKADIVTFLHQAQSDAGSPLPPLVPVVRDGAVPLSFAQQRLWFLAQLEPGGAIYNVPIALCFSGALDTVALEHSLNEIVRRHEVLRTTFPAVDGQPYQDIASEVALTLPVVDLRHLPAAAREVEVQRLAIEEGQQTFDLARGPLWRVKLLSLEAAEHVLLLTIHHILYDGWSHCVLLQELAALYTAFVTGTPPPLTALPIQYGDFAVWQRQRLQGEVLERHLTYWKKHLERYPARLELPTDVPRPPIETHQGARQSLVLPMHLTEALKALSQQEGGTLFMTLLAAFTIVLYRYTGQGDILVGSPIAGRDREETEGLVGFFANTLVLRTDLSGSPTCRELLGRVRGVCLGAYAHQELPFEKLVEELRPARHLSHAPLFQVMFVLQSIPMAPLALPGVTLSPLPVDNGTTMFDLTLSMSEEAGRLRAVLEYNTALFVDTTATRMLGHLQTVLEGMVANPDRAITMVPLLTAAERRQSLVTWNATQTEYPREVCLHELFEAQVERTPDAVAVVWGEQLLTYRDLNRRANQLAHHLRALGVGPEVCVGIGVQRSLNMVVGLLGVLKAGGAYVPLDPAYPLERLAFMVADAQPMVVVTQAPLRSRLPACGARVVCLDTEWEAIAHARADNVASGVTAEHLAYVIYTSGSTGKPKGVLIPHRAVVNHSTAVGQRYGLQASDRVLQFASLNFDAAVEEIFPSWLHGATVVLRPEHVSASWTDWRQFVEQERLTVLNLPTAYWHEWASDLECSSAPLPLTLRLVIVGGEKALPERLALWQRLVGNRIQWCNTYGTTEATITTTIYEPAPNRQYQAVSCVPIGRSLSNMQVYVLDTHLQPVPIGVPGELCIGGVGLAWGYLNRSGLTAIQFLPHSFSAVPGARLYRTGDRARFRPDGTLEYLGRLDQQVKVRGFRIELGEIEAVLEQHPAVHRAIVLAREETAGDTRLVAYVVSTPEQVSTTSALHSFLQAKLPDYMVPATFVWLDTLPLTPGGKVDRQALPVPDPTRPDLEETFVAPRTPIERQVAAIWCHLLGLERVGIHDNFFELGGHSLLAVRLVSRVRDATHVEVSLLGFFEAPTVVGIASLIKAARQTGPGPPAPAIVPIPRERALPASVTQEQLWRIDQVLPGMPGGNIFLALRLLGTLNVAALEQSCHEIIRRHEVLRTTFALVDGQLVQIIAPMLHVTLAAADLRVLPETKREEAVQRVIAAEVQQPFDLVQGPLLRISLLRLGEQEHILVLTMHHIISDGWSMDIFTQELVVLYDARTAGQPLPLPELSIQYADFAYWQRQWRHSAALQAQLAYWQEQLRDPLPMLELPTDRPRWAAMSFHAARQDLVVPRALSEALKNLSHREGSTLFMTLVAALKMLLYGYTAQADLRVGTLVANRTRRETEALIGLLVNTVILRTDLSGNPTCREVLQRVRATTLAAYTHQDLPYEDLVWTLESERHLDRRSLCQVLIILQNAPLRPAQRTASTLRFLEVDQSPVLPGMTFTTFDIVLALQDSPQGLAGVCLYRTALFDATTVHRMVRDFQQVLARLVTQPEQSLATLCTSLVSSGHDLPELTQLVMQDPL